MFVMIIFYYVCITHIFLLFLLRHFNYLSTYIDYMHRTVVVY